MSFKEDAPQIFVAGVEGIAFEGPNAVISFATPVLSADHKTREYRTNVRLIISIDALKQSLSFIENSLKQPVSAPSVMPVPETKQ